MLKIFSPLLKKYYARDLGPAKYNAIYVSVARRAGGTEGYYLPSERSSAASGDAGSNPDAHVCQKCFRPPWKRGLGQGKSFAGAWVVAVQRAAPAGVLPCARAASAAAGSDAQGEEEKKKKSKKDVGRKKKS